MRFERCQRCTSRGTAVEYRLVSSREMSCIIYTRVSLAIIALQTPRYFYRNVSADSRNTLSELISRGTLLTLSSTVSIPLLISEDLLLQYNAVHAGLEQRENGRRLSLESSQSIENLCRGISCELGKDT